MIGHAHTCLKYLKHLKHEQTNVTTILTILLPADAAAADVACRLKALSDWSCFLALAAAGLLGNADDTEEMEASDSRLTADKTGILALS